MAALRFANTIGLTLERGPITVVEDGDYRGEAVVPFTKDGNEVYLPYAVELGVRIVERYETRTETSGLSISGGYLIYEEYLIRSVLYVLENTTAKALTITIEAPIETGFELFETPTPAIETATERRWRVEVPGRGKVEFTRRQRQRTHRHEEIRNLDYEQLHYFLEQRWLDRPVLQQLRELLDNLAQIQKAWNERGKLDSERKTIFDRQEQLRANLTTLQNTGDEGTFRMRLLKQFEATEDRLQAIETRVEELKQQIDDLERRNNEILAALG